MRRTIGREEDELGLTDQILGRDVADGGQHAAVLRIVAVVAHREIVVGRDVVDRRVVERPVLAAAKAEFLDDAMRDRDDARSTRQALAVALLYDEGTGLP